MAHFCKTAVNLRSERGPVLKNLSKKQYLHITAYACDKFNGPVVAGALGVRETVVSRETQVRLLEGICLACGNRQDRLPDAGVQQAFVGPDSPRLRALIETANREQPADTVPVIVRGYIGMGGTSAPSQQVGLLRHVADAGFFLAGGVLVGTHAFLAYANVLGMERSATCTHNQ